MNVVRLADIRWEDRRNVDNWPSRAGMYYDNRQTELCIRLIDYPHGSTEPRHVHGGTHATTVLKGHAIVDGLTLGALDVVLGPSNEPHGPLHYPDGCKLLSAFQGSYHHSEVQALSSEKHYRLIQSKEIPWVRQSDGVEAKTLVDRGAGRLLVEAMRFSPGVKHAPQFLAALVVDGSAVVGHETLGEWDFVYADGSQARSTLSFPRGGTLLALTMRG